MKYKVLGYQKRYVSEDIIEADSEEQAISFGFNMNSVSYTHLTLPTNREV